MIRLSLHLFFPAPQGMEDLLQSAMNESPPEMQSQLQYMINRLQAEPGRHGNQGGCVPGDHSVSSWSSVGSPLSDQDSGDEGEEEDEGVCQWVWSYCSHG